MSDHRCPSEASAAREMEPTVTNSSAAAGVSDGDRAEKYTKELKTELKAAMLVVMSLVASVTYQAGLTLPAMSHSARKNVFATLNGFAFSCSVCNMILLMTEFVFTTGSRIDLMVIKGYMIVSLLALAVAYGAASCSRWDCTWNYCMWLPSYLFITTIVVCFVHKCREKKKK